MNTTKVDLLIHTFKYFTVHSSARKQPADLTYDELLDNGKSHKNTMADYHHKKLTCQESLTLPASVPISIDAIFPSENYGHSLSRTCSKCHTNLWPVHHLQSTVLLLWKNHWQHMWHLRTSLRSSRRSDKTGLGIQDSGIDASPVPDTGVAETTGDKNTSIHNTSHNSTLKHHVVNNLH